MSTETQEHESAGSTTETGDEEQRTSSDGTANSDDAAKGGDGDSSTSEDAFDASSYEESFGLPADTLKGIENAEDALEAIRGYTDKTLTAGLLSNVKGDTDATDAKDADTDVAKDAKSDDAAGKKESKNPELDALRAEVTDIKEKLVARDKKDIAAHSAAIDSRVDAEIDTWASPKYGTSKSRNFKQAKAVKEFQELVNTHIAGFQVQGKLPPIVESLLRQVRVFHDDEYKPTTVKKNSDAALGSPGTGSRSAKKDDGEPKNIHEALQQNSF